MRKIIIIILLNFILLSCNKGLEQENKTNQLSFGNKGQIYLSMEILDTLLTSTFNMTYPNTAAGYKAKRHATLCYDIEKDTTIWFKTDTMFITSPYPGYGSDFVQSGSQYFKNFKIGNSLIRILAKEELSAIGGPNNLYPIGMHTGIYLEKRDIYTGNVVLMKQLLAPGEFITGVNHDKFTLTNIINIGNKFYFGSNNNQIYCFDDNGVLQWKQSGFNPRISSTSPERGLLYNNSNKLSYLTNDGKLKLIDALTGNTIWSVACNPTPVGFEVLMTNKYLFTFSRDFINRYRIQDGYNGPDDYIPTQIFITNPPSPNIQPFSAVINDSVVSFWADRERLLSIGGELTEVNGVAIVNSPRYGKYLSIYPNSFFFVTHNIISGSPEAIMRIDFTAFNRIVWEKSFTGTPIVNQSISMSDLITDNNNLYLISSSNLNGYNFVPSNVYKRFGNTLYLYTINPGTGNIISKGKIFSNEQYSLGGAFAITYGNN